MTVGKNEVEYVSSLARITLSEEEKVMYTEQFNTILEYIHMLNKLELDEVEPTTHVLPLHNVLRKDLVKVSTQKMIEQVLEEAPEKEKFLFRVPSIIE